ncbi:MAG: hypothetical protein AAF488_07210 [Planctomycetota bacterium]
MAIKIDTYEERVAKTKAKRESINDESPQARRARKLHKRAQRKLARMKRRVQKNADSSKKKDAE